METQPVRYPPIRPPHRLQPLQIYPPQPLQQGFMPQSPQGFVNHHRPIIVNLFSYRPSTTPRSFTIMSVCFLVFGVLLGLGCIPMFIFAVRTEEVKLQTSLYKLAGTTVSISLSCFFIAALFFIYAALKKKSVSQSSSCVQHLDLISGIPNHYNGMINPEPNIIFLPTITDPQLPGSTNAVGEPVVPPAPIVPLAPILSTPIFQKTNPSMPQIANSKTDKYFSKRT